MSPFLISVYTPNGEMTAVCKYPEEAAVLAAFYGAGSMLKHNENVLWYEGHEEQLAAESFDYVATVCHSRFFKNALEVTI